MTQRRDVLRGLAALAASTAAPALLAQNSKAAVSILVGGASATDACARLLAQHMQEALGQPVIVVPKLGAGQRIALGECKRASPDGRTLMFVTHPALSLYPHIYTRLDYDPVADFTTIAGISQFDLAIATGPMTGATSLKQLMDWQRNQKGGAVFGSAPGNGSLSQFLGIATSLASNVPMTHVAYKESGPGIIDLASGRLPMMITALQPMLDMHKAGKIRVVAVAGSARSPLAPDTPTMKESGVNVESSTYAGLIGPARMPEDLRTRIQGAVLPFIGSPEVKERLAGLAMTPWPATGQQFGLLIAQESQRFEQLVKASGYQKEEA